MTRSTSTMATLLLFSSLAMAGISRGQMPGGWEDKLTDDTWIVGRVANIGELQRWVPAPSIQSAFVGVEVSTGPVVFFSTTNSFVTLISDPEQRVLAVIREKSRTGPPVSLSHADGITRVETPYGGASGSSTPCNAETVAAWAKLLDQPGDALLTVGLMARNDTGRLARELLPALVHAPPQLNLRQLLGDIESIRVQFFDQADRMAELSIGALDAEAAARAAAAIPALRHWIGSLENIEPQYASDLIDMILGGEIKIADQTVQIRARAVTGRPGLNELLGSLQGRQQAVQAMDNVKMLLLALHNFESAYREFPGPAFGKGDSPGLSWRVAVLPYIEELELYKEFHLDEPWDSEHNRKLIPRMPAVFRNPASTLKATEGRSSFIVPTAEGCAHRPGEPCRFKDFLDGTSNSLLLLAVSDDVAPVWTKPETRNIDLALPKQGLWRSPDGDFLGGRCDGSVALLSEENTDETIRRLLTIADGQTVTDVK